jgi:hypothetical protein
MLAETAEIPIHTNMIGICFRGLGGWDVNIMIKKLAVTLEWTQLYMYYNPLYQLRYVPECAIIDILDNGASLTLISEHDSVH